MNQSLSGDGFEITLERDLQEFWSLTEPDPNWRFVDAAGHVHTRAEDGGYPTLKPRTDGEYWCETCCDFHEDYVSVCKLCGEVVVPGSRTPTTPEVIAGPVRVSARFDERFKDFDTLRQAMDWDVDVDLDMPGGFRLLGVRATRISGMGPWGGVEIEATAREVETLPATHPL